MSTYSERFTKIYNSSKYLKKLFPKLSDEVMDSKFVDCLYRFLPLIERLIVEIYSLTNIINVEIKEQGTIRTINSILENNEDSLNLPIDIKEALKKSFSNDGIRNKLMHYHENYEYIILTSTQLYNIKDAFLFLCNKYEKEYELYNNLELVEIKLLDYI